MTKTALAMKEIAQKEAASKRDAEAKKYTADQRYKGSKYAADQSRKSDKARNIINAVTGGWKTFVNDPAEIVGKVISSSKSNSPEWYKRISGQGYNTGFSAYFPNGSELAADTYYFRKYTNSSVACLNIVPIFGGNNDVMTSSGGEVTALTSRIGTSALNLTAVEYQTSLRANNSRVGEYEPGDLMQVTLAGIDLHRRYTMMVKAISIAQTFTDDNINIGDKLLHAIGFAPKSFRDKLPTIKSRLHEIRDSISAAIHVPADIYYYEHVMMLESSIYADDDVLGPQIYVFNQPYTMSYDEENAVLKIGSEAVGWSYGDGVSVLDAIESDLNKLKYSSVLTTMWSDIKAGLSKEAVLPDFDDRIKILGFKKVDELLQQVLNATLPGILVSGHTMASPRIITQFPSRGTGSTLNPLDMLEAGCLSLRQNSQGLLFQGSALNRLGVRIPLHTYSNATTSGGFGLNYQQSSGLGPDTLTNPSLFNFYKKDVSDDDKLVASRLHTVWRRYSNHSQSYCFLNAETGGDFALIAITVAKHCIDKMGFNSEDTLIQFRSSLIPDPNTLSALNTMKASSSISPEPINAEGKILGEIQWQDGTGAVEYLPDKALLKWTSEFNYMPPFIRMTQFTTYYTANNTCVDVIPDTFTGVRYHCFNQIGTIYQCSVYNLIPMNRLAMKSLFTVPLNVIK